MKKSTLFLSTLLCLGISPLCVAQPAAPTPGQLLNLSKRNILNKDYIKAEYNARKSLSLAISPKDKGDALMLLGQMFSERKMVDQARANWRQAAALDDPTGEFPARAHVVLASSYLAQGQADKATAEYRTALDALNSKSGVDPIAKDILSLLLGNTYYRNRQFVLAKEQFKEVLRSNQKDSDFIRIALFRLSSTNIFLKDTESAVANLKQLFTLKGATVVDKEYAELLIKRLTSSGSLEERIQDFAKLQTSPDALDASFDSLLSMFL